MNKFCILIFLVDLFAVNSFAEKIFPPLSPMFYYHIAESTYRWNAKAYLDKALGADRVLVVDEATVGRHAHWKFILIIERETRRPMVAFQGTIGFRNWCANVKHTLSDPIYLHRDIETKLDEWQERLINDGFGPIKDLVGHSRGATFIHRVKSDWPIFRITFNGYQCREGSEEHQARTLNIRVRGDIFSKKPFSHKANYVTVYKNKKGFVRENRHLLRYIAEASTKEPEKITNAWVINPTSVLELSWEELIKNDVEETLISSPKE